MNYDSMRAPDNIQILKAHTLYVEGSLDEVVANILFPEITVEKLGRSRLLIREAKHNISVNSKKYYLIDRDHRSDESVRKIWQSFIDVNEPNLITWNLREIENYFINPKILEKSEYFIGDVQRLTHELERIINKIYLTDVANESIYSVVSRRFARFEEFELDYPTAAITDYDIKCRLQKNEKLLKYLDGIKSITMCNIIESFAENSNKVETDKVKYGIFSNEFLKYIKGKVVLNEIVDSSMFDKKTDSGKQINRKDCIERIVQKLLKDNKNLHDDFGKLRNHVFKRIELSN